jgi:hypothetical protein
MEQLCNYWIKRGQNLTENLIRLHFAERYWDSENNNAQSRMQQVAFIRWHATGGNVLFFNRLEVKNLEQEIKVANWRRPVRHNKAHKIT